MGVSKDFKAAITTTFSEGQKNTLTMNKNVVNRNYKKESNGNSRPEKYNMGHKNSLVEHAFVGRNSRRWQLIKVFFLKNRKKKRFKKLNRMSSLYLLRVKGSETLK